MTIAEHLKQQMDRSERFKQENFGAAVGDGFPEMFRELTRDEKIARFIGLNFILQMLLSDGPIKDLKTTPDGFMECAADTRVSQQSLTWLYWGIEIGRALEREQAAAEKSAAGMV